VNLAYRAVFSTTLLVILSGFQLAARDPLFRLTLHVVDDERAPVAQAEALIGAERRPKGDESGGKGVFVQGVTDEHGYFSAEMEAWDASQAGYRVQKKGHYGIWMSYRAKDPVHGKWQPWNPTIEVLLKRIKNPVPMYAKRVEIKIPESNKPIGYDLMLGDLVAPYGKGEIPDLIFEADRNVVSYKDYDGTLTLRFSNEGDGLVEHEIERPDPPGLRMPYTAPDDGYVPIKTWQESRHTSGRGNGKIISTASNRMNYFIRVRTIRDKEGKVVSALYGKIHGDFRWFIGARAPKSGLAFTYYLNPAGTRNIEYDPKRNLLKSSKHDDPDYENLAP
jgi:hypothetical protein